MLPCCLAAAACSGGEEEAKNKAAAAAAARPANMAAGQYATESEVTAFRSTDNQTPAVKAAVGDKASGAGCVTAGALPPPELFAGKDYKCSYKYSYIRDGTLNASLGCTMAGTPGEITMTVEGSYTATGFEAKLESNTYFPGTGDFTMSRKVSGRLTGPTCAPAEPDAKDKGKKAKAG
jgi:hypothetical protein